MWMLLSCDMYRSSALPSSLAQSIKSLITPSPPPPVQHMCGDLCYNEMTRTKWWGFVSAAVNVDALMLGPATKLRQAAALCCAVLPAHLAAPPCPLGSPPSLIRSKTKWGSHRATRWTTVLTSLHANTSAFELPKRLPTYAGMTGIYSTRRQQPQERDL